MTEEPKYRIIVISEASPNYRFFMMLGGVCVHGVKMSEPCQECYDSIRESMEKE
jgi:hypothetical protein